MTALLRFVHHMRRPLSLMEGPGVSPTAQSSHAKRGSEGVAMDRLV